MKLLTANAPASRLFSSSALHGFDKNWCAGLTVFKIVCLSAWPDSTNRKQSGYRSFTFSSSCTPLIPGMRMSVTITSYRSLPIACNASWPPFTNDISHSGRNKNKLRSSADSINGSSSTNKIRFAIPS